MTAPTCLAVMYHYVRDSEASDLPAIRALSPALFERQLDWLQDRYRLIDVDDLDRALGGRAPLPADAALLTFDDGFVDHHETVLPALRRRGLTGVFFLAHDACGPSPRVLAVHKTHVLLARLGADAFGRSVLQACQPALAAGGKRAARVFGADRWEHADERAIKNLLHYELPHEDAERVLDDLFARHVGPQEPFARSLYLDEAAIADMARAGMAFGYHTRSHRMLSRLTADEQHAEVRDGVAWIRELTGRERVPFCYPWGGPKTYTSETLRILEDTRYSMAFNTVRRRLDPRRDGRYELPRVDTRDLPPYTSGEPAPAEKAAEDA